MQETTHNLRQTQEKMLGWIVRYDAEMRQLCEVLFVDGGNRKLLHQLCDLRFAAQQVLRMTDARDRGEAVSAQEFSRAMDAVCIWKDHRRELMQEHGGTRLVGVRK